MGYRRRYEPIADKASAARANWLEWYHVEQRIAYSAADFHGQRLARRRLPDDRDCRAANISWRPHAMLAGANNRGLPQNVVMCPGVNSGLIIWITPPRRSCRRACSLAPRLGRLDPAGANPEDHLSVSTDADRKLRTVASNVKSVLAIDFLAAAQSVEWRAVFQYDPNKPAPRTSLRRHEAHVTSS